MLKKIYVISHTHWDREWYQDFQGFRIRLVRLVDELLDTMEQNPNYRYFMMDGHTALVDDYLEMRPENRERLLKLIQQGRIVVGPWYVMPDVFLVSGESLIRNLLTGFRKSRSWGAEPMKSGYVPDVFGHNSQMPQLFKGFGIDNAVLFRGFKGQADPSEIWWEGADGSQVLGLKLDEDRSYGDFYFFIRHPFADRQFNYEEEELVARAEYMLEYKQERATTDLQLGLDGVDHVEIEPKMPWILDILNRNDELIVEFVHSTLEEYLNELRPKLGNLRRYKGELRVPAYQGELNAVLDHVLSSRIHLKQLNFHCEGLLEKWAEPWGTFASLEGLPYEQNFLSRAWEYLLLNHAHDSICGCSVDQVHRDMVYRFNQVESISENLINEQLRFISNHLDLTHYAKDNIENEDFIFTIYQSSSELINGVVDTEIELFPENMGMNPGHGQGPFRIYGLDGEEVPYQLLGVEKNKAKRFRQYRDTPYEKRVDRYRIALEATIPSFGYTTYIVKPLVESGPAPREYHQPKRTLPARYRGTMRKNENIWDNGVVLLTVHGDGTIDLKHHYSNKSFKGLLRFEDEADIGEGWHHTRPITNEVILSMSGNARISVVNEGPLLTRIKIQKILPVPSQINSTGTTRGKDDIDLFITTYIDLKKNDPILYCRTIVDNKAKDHILRVLFPTDLETESFYTSTPFDLVKRDVNQPDYIEFKEEGTGVSPHNGIMLMNDQEDGIAVYSQGLYEAAVKNDNSKTMAMTLFRSTQKEVMTDGSGGGQLQGELTFSYAIRPVRAKVESKAKLWKEQQRFVSNIRTITRRKNKKFEEVPFTSPHKLPLEKAYVEVDSEDLVVSAIKRAENGQSYIIRLYNISENNTSGCITFDRMVRSAAEVKLDEQYQRDLSVSQQTVYVECKTKQIITIRIEF